MNPVGMVWFRAVADGPSVQASSHSALVKAAAQVGDRNWNWERKGSRPTIGIFMAGIFKVGDNAC